MVPILAHTVSETYLVYCSVWWYAYGYLPSLHYHDGPGTFTVYASLNSSPIVSSHARRVMIMVDTRIPFGVLKYGAHIGTYCVGDLIGILLCLMIWMWIPTFSTLLCWTWNFYHTTFYLTYLLYGLETCLLRTGCL